MPKLLILLWLSLAFVSGCTKTGGGADEPKSEAITKKVAEKLARVQEHTKEKEWDDALEELDDIEQSKYLNDHERARIHQARAIILMAQENPSDPTAAVTGATESLEKAVALNALPRDEQLRTMFHLGELYIMTEQFEKAGDTLADYIGRAEAPEKNAHFMAASAYSQVGKFEQALPHAKEAVARADKPELPWHKLLVSIHFELKQDEEVAASLEKLIESFPREGDAYLQLAATYGVLGDSERAAKTLERAQSMSLLTSEPQLVKLAHTHLTGGTPAKCAALFEKHFGDGKISKSAEHLELYAQCAIKAKDAGRASKLIEAEAKASGSGEAWLVLGRLESERESYLRAADALEKALAAGGLAKEGEALIMLGVALHNTKRFDAALRAFQRAKAHPESAKEASRRIAEAKGGGKKAK